MRYLTNFTNVVDLLFNQRQCQSNLSLLEVSALPPASHEPLSSSLDSALPSSHQLVCALGGCHINGYPFPQEKSFLDIAIVKAGWNDAAVLRCAPASLRAINTWLGAHAQDIAGARIILQIGNYESIRGANLADTQGHTINEALPIPSTRFGNRIGKNPFKELIKYILVIAKIIMGRSPYNSADFSEKLEHTFTLIRNAAPAEVIVLASFSSYSRAVNLCRRLLNIDMLRLTQRFGFTWLDSYAALQQARRTHSNSLFIDTIHLSESGHEIVAAQIADHWRQQA